MKAAAKVPTSRACSASVTPARRTPSISERHVQGSVRNSTNRRERAFAPSVIFIGGFDVLAAPARKENLPNSIEPIIFGCGESERAPRRRDGLTPAL
jgi:hypothetical protein